MLVIRLLVGQKAQLGASGPGGGATQLRILSKTFIRKFAVWTA